MYKFENYTPHAIMVTNGETYQPVGLARVSSTFGEFKDGVCSMEYGAITGLPEPVEGVRYIVSAIVLAAAKATGRTDCVAPATGHPDCVRENGFIKSVPGFVC